MIVREYKESDWPRIVELHAQGITPENQLPDPASPLVIVKECVMDGNRIVNAGLARLELNVTLMVDHQWGSPHARLEAIRLLQESMNRKASAYGLDWAYAEAGRRFGKRLESLGWVPAKDGLYFLRIN
jgi:hypothetical protein